MGDRRCRRFPVPVRVLESFRHKDGERVLAHHEVVRRVGVERFLGGGHVGAGEVAADGEILGQRVGGAEFPVLVRGSGVVADSGADERGVELARIELGVQQGLDSGLQVNAGHGLNYHNVQAIAAIPGLAELNIGHSIVARAVFSGLQESVREMKRLMREAQAR